MNKFEDGQKVVWGVTGETVTIDKWAISRGPSKHQVRITYTIKEYPSTFFFENELAPALDTLLPDKREE